MAENSTLGLTKTLGAFIAGSEASEIPATAYEHAKVAFMDWIAVIMGGKDDPLVQKLVSYADLLGGRPQATVLGYGIKKTVSQAALINGSASHVLDYDDTLVSFFGHPTVTLYPSLLALAEWQEKSGEELLTAYLIGLQAGSCIGVCAGLDHYMTGWHATSTLGHLASAAGCARLLGLDQQKATYALGIGATQSSGLKRVFGTMCKPFHAGRASEAGLLAALLAQDGFTSAEDILEGPLGFFQALKGAVNQDEVAKLGTKWDVQDLAQKYHASCHATHSPLEAAMAGVKEARVGIDEIRAIRVYSSQLALDAAGKMEPTTGLEGKFSIPFCVANALVSGETGYRAFTDEKVNDPTVRALMKKITVTLDQQVFGLASRVEVETHDGKVHSNSSDILQQIPPLEIKKERIRAKFFDLCEPVLGEKRTKKMAKDIAGLEKIKSMRSFTRGL